MDMARVEAALSDRTRAIIPVHLFGRSADMSALTQVLERTGRAEQVCVIEDAAQALGARHQGQAVGTMAPLACLSFFPSKNLGAFGDGGAVISTDSALTEKLRVLRSHGAARKYHHEIIGINSRLDALQAAILRVRLTALDGWLETRRRNAALYRQLFAETSLGDILRLPCDDGEDGAYWHTYNQFNLMVPQRDDLRAYLKAKDIGTAVYYPEPLHLQPCFADTGACRGDAPVSEAACAEALAIPIFPGLTSEQAAYVVSQIEAFYREAQA